MSIKVFGIGFHKTGTKSLGAALELLGYRVCGPIGVRNDNIGAEALEMALRTAQDFDAFQDNPWPILYRELDSAFPGGKFILTVCSTKSWLERARRYFGEAETPMRRWIYGAGSPIGNEAIYADRFDRHNREVVEYFKDRPSDLLVFPLTESPSWTPLCDFLGKPIPEDIPFPHKNRSG